MAQRTINRRGVPCGMVLTLLVATLVATLSLGCGDGVGRPILVRDVSAGHGGGSSDHSTAAGGQSAAVGDSASDGGKGSLGGSGGASFATSLTQQGGSSVATSPNESGGRGSGGTGSPGNSGGANAGGSGQSSSLGGIGPGPGGSNGGLFDGLPPPPLPSSSGPAPCSNQPPWPPEHAAAELELLNNINALRQSGAPCPGGPSRSSAPALVMVEELRCVARAQSFDKFAGKKLATRISDANYPASAFAEVTASSPPVNFDIPTLLWFILGNPGNCTKVFDATYSVVGIGFATDLNQGYWTIDLASP